MQELKKRELYNVNKFEQIIDVNNRFGQNTYKGERYKPLTSILDSLWKIKINKLKKELF